MDRDFEIKRLMNYRSGVQNRYDYENRSFKIHSKKLDDFRNKYKTTLH